MWKRRLLDTLRTLDNSFCADELAYLSLTSKTEHVVRDRLAFALHAKFAPGGFKVAREWKNRYDLAILGRESDPCCLVELKSILAFDVKNTTRVPVLPKLLASDREKLRAAQVKFARHKTECFQLLLLAMPLDVPSLEQDSYIKYSRRHRQDPANSERVIRQGVLQSCGSADSGKWSAGSAYGVRVSMHYWLFKSGVA